jgi:rod shape-determining protein MreD
MRNAAFICLGILLILTQANLYRVLGALVPSEVDSVAFWPLATLSATPSLILPLVIFLGVQEPSLSRGALLTFTLGYLLDVFSGAPMFLFTFVSVAIFLLSRVLGVRLTAQTPLARVPLVFGYCVVESAIVLMLLAIFGTDNRRPLEIATIVLPRAVMTALFSPLVFKIAQRLHLGTSKAQPAAGGVSG